MLVLASNIEIRLYFICLSVAFEFILQLEFRPNNNNCMISTDWDRYNHLKFSFTSVIKSFLSVGLELHKNVTIIIKV